ncbi:MAG: S8 family serine peptidase [Verrucomicrobia bacterium]|nr:S8 family serine peptidase [Verrucomicrobiota bacterium]
MIVRGWSRLFVAVCFALWLVPVMAQSTTSPALTAVSGLYRPDRILVRFKANAPPEKRSQFNEANGLKVRRGFRIVENGVLLDLPNNSTVEAMVDRCEASDLIESAEPDYWVHAFASPNDPSYANGTLWNLNNTGRSGGRADADIDAPEAWNVATDASKVIVAVIDSGIRYTHQDLARNMWSNPGETGFDRVGRSKATNGVDDDGNGYVDDVHGIDTVLNTGDPNDPDGHGTHVAGIIGAVGNNRLGVVGVTWTVQLIACRFLDTRGSGSISDAIQCIDYARDHGASIINASWGNQNNSLFLESAIRQCRALGIIVVAAAGNEAVDNDRIPSYPANYDLDNVVSVTGTTRTDSLAAAANFGAISVDLAAPGESIYSTYNRSDSAYAFLSGTSMAVPHVTGALALARQLFPGESYKQSIGRILATTDPIDGLKGRSVTEGRLNLDSALRTSLVADFAADIVTGSPPLTVRFTNGSFGNSIRSTWNFGDGSPGNTEFSPRHVFEREGEFTVTLTVRDAVGNQRTKSRVISVAANYSLRSEPFDWIDPSSMSSIRLPDDGVSSARALPFEFKFYGKRYREFFVGANGLIGFINQQLDTPFNSNLPNAVAPNAIICPWWDDLNPASGGEIRIGTIGAAPKRSAVVSWVNVPHQSRRTYSFTFQIVLREESDEILFQYLKVEPNRSRGAGKTAAVGIENANGTVAKRYAYGGSTLLKNNQTILFAPPETGGLLVQTTADFVSSGEAGGPFSPERQTYTLENTSNSSLTWLVRASVEWLSFSTSTGTLLPGQQTTVSATVNSLGTLLAGGSYSGVLLFENLESGNGNTSRDLLLTITGRGAILDVTPASELRSSGFTGGPFNPASGVYRLENRGDAELHWISETEADWVFITPREGLLAPGEGINIEVSITDEARNLADGRYVSRAIFRYSADPSKSTDREVVLTVISPSAKLAIEPQDSLRFSELIPLGNVSSRTEVNLMNPGSTSLAWHASSSELWNSLTPDHGRLEAGEAVPISVFINENANLLSPGVHDSLVVFSSTGGASSASLKVSLEVARSVILTLRILDSENLTVPLSVSGKPGSVFRIETSRDLIHWTLMRSVTITDGGGVEIVDSEAAGSSPRFYRALLE